MGVDLLHTRVNGDRHANGVVGGYTPAPPTDRHHPLWGINGGPGSESALAARLGGAGVLGAGALGLGRAARMGAAGLTGSGQVGLSGAGALRVGSYSGPGYGAYRAPTAGGPGVGGTTGVPGGSSGPVAAGRGAAQGAGGYMGGSGAGAGVGKDEKKKPRRKYTPFRVDDCEDGIPPGYVNPQSQTYGSDRAGGRARVCGCLPARTPRVRRRSDHRRRPVLLRLLPPGPGARQRIHGQGCDHSNAGRRGGYRSCGALRGFNL